MYLLKKIFKIIFFNLCFILLIIALFDVIWGITNVFLLSKYDYKLYSDKPEKEILNRNLKSVFNSYFNIPEYRYIRLSEFRKPAIYPQNKKSDIVLMGCSYTHGDGLKNNEAFHSVLSNYTKRNVYNFGLPGGSPREMLYILKNTDLLDKLIKNRNNTEYIIYTFMNDHPGRLYYQFRPRAPIYDFNNKLCEPKLVYIPLYIENSNIYEFINEIKFLSVIKHNPDQLTNLFYSYIDEIFKEIKLKFSAKNKEVKFIIFVYNDYESIDWTRFENKGIIIIKAKDIIKANLADSEFMLEDNMHPNAKAWEIIVPELAKKLNL